MENGEKLGTTHWLCERRRLCRALIHTKGLEIIKRTNEHCHAPDEKSVSCCEVKVSIKRKAKESQDGSYHIVGECLETISEGIAAVLPKLDSLKRTIQRQRVRHLAAPVQPDTLEKLILPEQYKRTCKDEQFILYDSGPETQRILIFGTQRNLEMLQRPECGWQIAHLKLLLYSSHNCTSYMLFEEVQI